MARFEGNIVDVEKGRVFYGAFETQNGRICAVEARSSDPKKGAPFYVPGFVDAHVHVESSMLTPSEFARAAVVHGTVAAVSDPHEIANVLGVAGVRYMCADAARAPFYFHFGVPSCVPATAFETSGAAFDADVAARLFDEDGLGYLAEMMNFPGALAGNPAVLAMIEAARSRGKPIDGHAPGLSGEPLARYAALGISTDHECATLAEGRERIRNGIKVLLREGSAARNFEALWPLISESPDDVMLCHDDAHPDDMQRGMLDCLLARLVARGADPVAALRAATLNPVRHYGLPCGLLREGDSADFAEIEDLRAFKTLRTFVRGQCVARGGKAEFPFSPAQRVNRFEALPRAEADFCVPVREGARMRVIGSIDGELLTEALLETPTVRGGFAVADASRDMLKIAVINRYAPRAPVALGFVRGFGLRRGALASSVAHDSHNIVAVGADDASLCRAVNAVIENKGALVSVDGERMRVLPLPIAGLMSDKPAAEVAEAYTLLNADAAALGSPMRAPYMTLAFMALPVIPSLKMTDRGLFDVDAFRPVDLWE